MSARHIGFLTSEYVTEQSRAGGLASYVRRLSRVLAAEGHRVEVFVLSDNTPTTIEDEHVRVHRVNPLAAHRRRNKAIRRARSLRDLLWAAGRPRQAVALADAAGSVHDADPFDLLQSTNESLAGLFVDKRCDCTHVIRASSAPPLWDQELGRSTSLTSRMELRLARDMMRQANACYAPSDYVAHWWRSQQQVDMQTLRPPAYLEEQPAEVIPPAIAAQLPPRYIVHFGQIGRLKGAVDLAAALPKAWAAAPNLHMVWAGMEHQPGFVEACRPNWGEHRDQIHYLGPLDRRTLYAVVQQSVAAALPSRLDNLPNTVIESLQLGVGVLGTRGCSIDELVEPGSNGELIDIGNVDALATMLASAWQNEYRWQKDGLKPSPVIDAMQPQTAAANLLALADTSRQ